MSALRRRPVMHNHASPSGSAAVLIQGYPARTRSCTTAPDYAPIYLPDLDCAGLVWKRHSDPARSLDEASSSACPQIDS